MDLREVPSQIPQTKRVQPWRATTFHLFHLIDRIRRPLHRRQMAARIQQASDQES